MIHRLIKKYKRVKNKFVKSKIYMASGGAGVDLCTPYGTIQHNYPGIVITLGRKDDKDILSNVLLA